MKESSPFTTIDVANVSPHFLLAFRFFKVIFFGMQNLKVFWV